MFLKSLLTGAVLAGLAGSVVYFGTGGEIAQADIIRAVNETKSVTKTVTTTVKDTFEDITKTASAEDDVVKEASLKTAVFSDVPTMPNETLEDDQSQKKWLSRYLGRLKSEQEGVPYVEEDAKTTWAAKIENNKTIPSLLTPAKTELDEVYHTVLKQAESLEDPQLRDRAYLSLIDYIIRNNAYDKAPSIIQKISQAPLRDTARSNVAVGFARKGERGNAFAVLDGVETAALSDVLRLQVIEAMTTPEAQ